VCVKHGPRFTGTGVAGDERAGIFDDMGRRVTLMLIRWGDFLHSREIFSLVLLVGQTMAHMGTYIAQGYLS